MVEGCVRVVCASHALLYQQQRAHGPRRAWGRSAIIPRAGRYRLHFPPLLSGRLAFFIERASAYNYTFKLAYARVNALDIKERMLICLHALERLNRVF